MSPNKIFLLFVLIVVVVGAVAFIRMYQKPEQLSWDVIKKEVCRLPKIRTWLLLVSLAFVLVFTAFYFVYDNRRASVVITLNYAEAYQGLNANGTRYNMNEIICEDVLERVIEKGAVEGITAKGLQSCLTVEPVVEGGTETEEDYHISTEFRVTYRGNRALNIDAESLVRLIGFAYKEYYIERYADNFESLDINITPEEDFADLDYLDIVDYLSNQVAVIQNYMYGLADANASFTASNGETFYSLAAKCENVGQVQIQDNLKAYILDQGISKDAAGYIGRLEYDNTRMDYEQQKALAGFNVRTDAIQLYAEEMTRIVLVPTWDTEGEYYMGRTKVGIDQLSIEAEQYSQQAADYSKEMETNRSVIQSYSASGSSGQNAYVDDMISTISSEIMNIAKEATLAGQEYSETRMNKCVSVTVEGSSFAKYLILAAGLFVFFYLAADFLFCQFVGHERKER